jgi:hypothetical protein
MGLTNKPGVTMAILMGYHCNMRSGEWIKILTHDGHVTHVQFYPKSFVICLLKWSPGCPVIETSGGHRFAGCFSFRAIHLKQL